MQKIKSFRSFTEERVKELVTTFGRFSPPTIGYGKLLDKVVELAKGKTYRIYASQSEDTKKNPLNYEDKIKFMRKMFPAYGRNILLDRSIKNVFDIAVKAYDDGFNKLTLVVGSDRIAEFRKLLDKYHGVKGAHGYYEFKDGIDIKYAGERDPDAEGVTGMSASKMRAAAAENDLATFSKGLPSDFTDSKELFNAVRKGMGLKESHDNFKSDILLPQQQTISEKREQYIAGKLFKVGSKVWSEKMRGMEYIVLERHSNFVVCETYDSEVRTKLFINDLHETENQELVVVDKNTMRDG